MATDRWSIHTAARNVVLAFAAVGALIVGGKVLPPINDALHGGGDKNSNQHVERDPRPITNLNNVAAFKLGRDERTGILTVGNLLFKGKGYNPGARFINASTGQVYNRIDNVDGTFVLWSANAGCSSISIHKVGAGLDAKYTGVATTSLDLWNKRVQEIHPSGRKIFSQCRPLVVQLQNELKQDGVSSKTGAKTSAAYRYEQSNQGAVVNAESLTQTRTAETVRSNASTSSLEL